MAINISVLVKELDIVDTHCSDRCKKRFPQHMSILESKSYLFKQYSIIVRFFFSPLTFYKQFFKKFVMFIFKKCISKLNYEFGINSKFVQPIRIIY